jgi:hypothetical protein
MMIKNPSVEVQMAAVKQNGHAIQFIKNPSVEVQMEAVRQNGYAIRHIKNPSVEAQMEAVKQHGNAIRHIKNPSVEVQMAYLSQIPEINYMFHSHVYVKGAPFTKSPVPCGAIEEVNGGAIEEVNKLSKANMPLLTILL